jgi:hypothetical protein
LEIALSANCSLADPEERCETEIPTARITNILAF